jgi:antitoxin (DNA-binding transcriptional repressor) of toxin-antitoxin stability system
MATASIRDLRTRFPRVRALLAVEGELVVTEHGKPALVLRPYAPPPKPGAKRVRYFQRLLKRQPRPISPAAARALDDADRGER